jgi:hypothetical protein
MSDFWILQMSSYTKKQPLKAFSISKYGFQANIHLCLIGDKGCSLLL